MIALSGIGVFSMKRTKSVVSLMYDSCFLAIGCKSESMKLEMRSVGPPLSFRKLLVFRLNSVCGF